LGRAVALFAFTVVASIEGFLSNQAFFRLFGWSDTVFSARFGERLGSRGIRRDHGRKKAGDRAPGIETGREFREDSDDRNDRD
jgi:hypothetical protein